MKNSLACIEWRRRARQPARRRRLAVEFLEGRALLASFTIDSPGDLGDADLSDGEARDSLGNTTLRAVIEHINNLGGAHQITFGVSGDIALEASLPPIVPTVEIDGRGADGDRIRLTRSPTATSTVGLALSFAGAQSTIRNFADISISLLVGSDGSRVEGNYTGVSRDGLTARGGGISVYSSGNTIGGVTEAARNVTTGIYVTGSTNTIIGNHVGVTADGTRALAGMSTISGGVQVTDGADNRIGGMQEGEFNVIGGVQKFSGENFGAGVFIGGGNFAGTPLRTVVAGNRIGTNREGNAAIPNGVGVQLSNMETDEATYVVGNLISGNSRAGVHLWASSGHRTTNVEVRRNVIGLARDGVAALGNRTGVLIAGASGNWIGGSEEGDGNIISGNSPAGSLGDGVGVAISCTGLFGQPCNQFANNNRIYGNRIGVQATGSAYRGNASFGVLVGQGNENNRIGGPGDWEGNAIAGNGQTGVYLFQAHHTIVQGNALVSNGGGVFLYGDASDNQIGGTEPGEGNTIASNVNVGVSLYPIAGGVPARNAILGNSMYDNGFLGIDLGNDNHTPNDLGVPAQCPATPGQCPDADTGPNGLQNAPEVTRLGDQAVRVTLDSVPGTEFRIELFENEQPDPSGYGEGQRFHEAFTVTTDARGHVSVDRQLGEPLTLGFVAATATRIVNGVPVETSEFSGSSKIVVNSTLDLPDNNPGDGKVEIGAPGNIRQVTVDGQQVNMITLRAALMEANALTGSQIVTFGIPTTDPGFSGGVYTIRPAVNDSSVNQEDVAAANVQLKITDTVFVDATTQPGFDTSTRLPIVRLDGSLPTAGADGLLIDGNGSTVRGLIFNRFRDEGIDIARGDGNRLEGNLIGVYQTGDSATAPDGTSMRNGGYGVYVHSGSSNVIGGDDAGTGNVISGNLDGGVRVDGTASDRGNVIAGNMIGVNRAGTAAIGNGSTTFVAPGVHIHGGTNNVVGSGSAAGSNVISGNTADGVLVTGAASGTYLFRNLIGVDRTGETPLPNGQNGVRIGDAELGGARDTRVENSNTISANRFAGVFVRGSETAGTVISENFIGTNALGLTSGAESQLGNGAQGIRVEDAPGTEIGDILGGNVISGNLSHGVLILDTTPDDSLEVGSIIIRNRIGISADGNTALENQGDGVRVEFARNTRIGGSEEDGNVISANRGAGIRLLGYSNASGGTGQGSLIGGNFIGTDETGASIGNEGTPQSSIFGNAAGLVLEHSSANRIGFFDYSTFFETSSAGNVISGNHDYGVHVVDASSKVNWLSGNRIGVDKSGLIALGKQRFGLWLKGVNNEVGGPTVDFRNIIASNTWSNIVLDWNDADGSPQVQNNKIYGNLVGVDVTGQQSLGVSDYGIEVRQGRGNQIGGVKLTGDRNVYANTIGGFREDGVYIEYTRDSADAGNLIVGNFIGVATNGRSLCDQSVCASGSGIHIVSGDANIVGGVAAGEGNTIAHNGKAGVSITAGPFNAAKKTAIIGNSIYANGRLGIDLDTEIEDVYGVSQDAVEGTVGDLSPNNRQRAPLLESVDRDPQTARVTATGTLTSVPGTRFRIELFASDAIDPSGHGEGQRLLNDSGEDVITTDGTGRVAFTIQSDRTAGPSDYISATVTRLQNDVLTDTSEFSNTLQLGTKSIRGIVYLDRNGNASRDTDAQTQGLEAGIGQWLVTLFNVSTGTEVGQVLTGADGRFRFTIPEVGEYRVTTETRAGWLTTTRRTSPSPDSATVVVDESPTPDIDFGKFQVMRVRGESFEDLNVNGARDADEPLLTGPFTVYVDLPGSEADRQQSLQSSATYDILQIGPGTSTTPAPKFTVDQVITGTEFLEVGPILPVEYAVWSDLNQVVNFANIRPMTVVVDVFHDLNGDGVRQSAQGENLLDDWTIELDLNDDGSSDAPGPEQTRSGGVTFSNVGIGAAQGSRTITVHTQPQAGWNQTTVTPVWNMQSGQTFRTSIGQTRDGAIHGFKFEDLDADRIYNGADRPVEGVIIGLYADPDRDGVPNSLLVTTTTAGDGGFSFPNLRPSQYVVSEIVPTGAVATTQPVVANLLSGQVWVAESGMATLAPGQTERVASSLAFGNFYQGAIHGYKFNDLDGQGVDNGDPRVAEITVTLNIDANEDGVFESSRTTTTDGQGYYGFRNLGPGRYQVVETLPAGQVRTTPAPAVIDLRSGEVWVAQGGMALVTERQVQVLELDLAFGNFTLVDLSGVKYLDVDADGTRDPGESGLSGWTIQLDLDNDGGVDRTTTTGFDGSYLFRDVGPGTHTLTEVQRPFFAQTAPAGGRHLVTTVSDRDVARLDFGNRTFQSVIAGTVYRDLDGDGVRDDDDTGFADTIVYIDANNDGVLNHQSPGSNGACGAGTVEICWTTDDSGGYAFALPVGTYLVRQVGRDGWRQTQPGDPGFYVIEIMDDGQTRVGYDFGNQRQGGAIHGVAYVDLAGDGTSPLEWEGDLVFVTLRRETAPAVFEEVDSVAIETNGEFHFVDLPPGTYDVELVDTRLESRDRPAFRLEAGEVRMAFAGQVTTSAGETPIVDARLRRDVFFLAEVRGYVFEDLDRNGFDDQEPRVAGIAVSLEVDQDGDGLLEDLRVTTTNAQGEYRFEGLAGQTWYSVLPLYGEERIATTAAPDWFQALSGDVWIWDEDQAAGLASFQYPYEDIALALGQIALSWTNANFEFDVNDDLFITSLDALLIINQLNEVGGGALPPLSSVGTLPWPYLDVSEDGALTSLDGLLVINYLNEFGGGPIPEGEADDTPSWVDVPIELWCRPVTPRIVELRADVTPQASHPVAEPLAFANSVESILDTIAGDVSWVQLRRGKRLFGSSR